MLIESIKMKSVHIFRFSSHVQYLHIQQVPPLQTSFPIYGEHGTHISMRQSPTLAVQLSMLSNKIIKIGIVYKGKSHFLCYFKHPKEVYDRQILNFPFL